VHTPINKIIYLLKSLTILILTLFFSLKSVRNWSVESSAYTLQSIISTARNRETHSVASLRSGGQFKRYIHQYQFNQ